MLVKIMPGNILKSCDNSDSVAACAAISFYCDSINPGDAELFLFKPWRKKFFLFLNHHKYNSLVCSFCFIGIPMLRIYGHYEYCNFSSAGTVFIRQNLTSTDDERFKCQTQS